MKKNIIYIILLLNSCFLKAQDNNALLVQLPKAELLTNIFYIKAFKSGTSFLINESGKEYLITAKHLFDRSTKNKDAISFKLEINNSLIDLKGNVYFHNNSSLDIAVIKLSSKLNKPYNLPNYEIGIKGLVLSQDCYFLGFPYGLSSNTDTINSGGRIPLVKKGIVSAFYNDSNIPLLLIDGHNNPGFSGGPVVYYNFKEKKNKIFGVVSSYVGQKNVGGVNINNRPYKFNYSENSGIVNVHPAEWIKEILKTNSI